MRIRFVWAAVVPALFLASPAQAQWADFIPSVIANTIMSTMQSNNAEALCMRGNGPSSKRVNELKAASTVTMSGQTSNLRTITISGINYCTINGFMRNGSVKLDILTTGQERSFLS